MSILSPTDRTVLWRTVITSGPDERASLLRVLSGEILGSVGRRLDLYGGYEGEVIDSVMLLDVAGLLGRDDLREAFEEADEDDERAREFVALLVAHLGQAADVDRLGADDRVKAVRLAAGWQRHLADRAGPESGDWLSAAQVAACYGVTPQAVYKWIRAGRVQAEQRPGGSWRLPAAQFARQGVPDPERLAALKVRLLERSGHVPAVSDEALAEEIVDRRRS